MRWDQVVETRARPVSVRSCNRSGRLVIRFMRRIFNSSSPIRTDDLRRCCDWFMVMLFCVDENCCICCAQTFLYLHQDFSVKGVMQSEQAKLIDLESHPNKPSFSEKMWMAIAVGLLLIVVPMNLVACRGILNDTAAAIVKSWIQSKLGASLHEILSCVALVDQKQANYSKRRQSERRLRGFRRYCGAPNQHLFSPNAFKWGRWSNDLFGKTTLPA